MQWEAFDWLLDAALREEKAEQDVTTRPLIDHEAQAGAELVAMGDGVICGLPLAARLAARFDPGLVFEQLKPDGEPIEAGQVVATLRGRAASILTVERPMLNFLQRLSGIATFTSRFVRAVEGTGARIFDTRKTTPGWRKLEKYAVACGGGCNHRMDLNEQVLIKDNHLRLLRAAQKASASDLRECIAEAVRRAREAAQVGMIIEIEVEELEEVEPAAEAGADIIMLDNMSVEQIGKAVARVRRIRGIHSVPLLEASGGIRLDNVRAYAETGVDRISVGALTHSAEAFDLSLQICT